MSNKILEKTLTRWINFKLRGSNCLINNLYEDISNGSIAKYLLEKMGAPKMRAIVAPHSIAQCFNFFRRNGVNLNIQEDDVLQKNEESVLYFVWHIVLYDIFRYLKVSGNIICEEGIIKTSILQWIREITRNYKGANVDNFQGSSWQSGLSFNAIINFYHPNLFDYDNCFDDKSNIDVLNHAFNKAEVLGIGQLLDAEDIDKIDDDQNHVEEFAIYYKQNQLDTKNYLEKLQDVIKDDLSFDQVISIRKTNIEKRDSIKNVITIREELVTKFPQLKHVIKDVENEMEYFEEEMEGINSVLNKKELELIKFEADEITNNYSALKETLSELISTIGTMEFDYILKKDEDVKHIQSEISDRLGNLDDIVNECSTYNKNLNLIKNVDIPKVDTACIKLFQNWSKLVQNCLAIKLSEEATNILNSSNNVTKPIDSTAIDSSMIIKNEKLDAFFAKKDELIAKELLSDRLANIFADLDLNLEKRMQAFAYVSLKSNVKVSGVVNSLVEHYEYKSFLNNITDHTKPLEVKVKLATRFFDCTGKVATYKTDTKNRGVVLIVNNSQFRKHPKRDGAEVDVKNLMDLFTQMHMKVVIHQDKSKADFMAVIKEFTKTEYHDKVDICFIIIMSHGCEGVHSTGIVCTEGATIDSYWIEEQFNNEKCPFLIQIPKIFIYQACRGYSYNVTRTQSDSVIERRVRDDMLIAHSTLPHYKSHRDIYVGSWYIQLICEVFMLHAHDTDVEEMLKMVDYQLAELKSEHKTMQTSSYTNEGFNRRCYIHPGIYRENDEIKHF